MKKTGIIVGLIVLLGLGGIAGGYYYFVQRPNITVGDDGIIFIQPGDSFETVMTTLISSGYVKNEYTLRKLAELKKYPSAVKTGRYRLVDKMNNNQLINMLRAGRQEPVHLTFNNIRTLEDFAAILSRQLGIDSTEFLQLARNAEYVKKLSFTPENFIGMFIPNTYQVYWHTPVEDFIQRMYKEYRKFWTEERLVKARKASAVKTGRYRLVDKMNNNQLINMLRAGRQEPVHLTFNNIRTLEDFAAILSRQLGIDSTEFLQLARNAEYVKKLSFTPENFIGMFIPNTYQVYWHTPVEDFIQRMYKEYRKFWTEERLVKARKADLSPMDILILASIVEEETNIADEYPVIAGVYINRLNKGWKLEACPTLKFAWGDFSIRRVLDKHMEIDSPYNTYKNTGLPPGPVRMPSIRVIDAVLNYQHHDYMFFCAKSDFSGSHYFSRTLREHNRHANEYHRALNIKRIY